MAMPAIAPPEIELLGPVGDDAAEVEGVVVVVDEVVLVDEEMELVTSAAAAFQPPFALVETTMFAREGVASAICIATDADDEAARELTPRFGLGNQLQQ